MRQKHKATNSSTNAVHLGGWDSGPYKTSAENRYLLGVFIVRVVDGAKANEHALTHSIWNIDCLAVLTKSCDVDPRLRHVFIRIFF